MGRKQGKISKTVGNGLRRVLHPYINTKTYLSVLFTLSPSVNNAKATESTLKFAVTAGMVKVKPIVTKGKVNFKSLVAELKAHIEQQEKMIDANNNKIEAIRRQQNLTTRVVAMIRLHKLEWLRYSVKWLMMMVRLRLLMSIKHQRLMMRVLKQLWKCLTMKPRNY